MLIDSLNGNSLVITLHNDDLTAFSVNSRDLSVISKESSALITEIVALSMIKLGVCPKKKLILIEPVKSSDGYTISVSIHPKPKRKKYSIKHRSEKILCYFLNAGDMLDAVEHLYNTAAPNKSILYSCEGRGYLLPVVVTAAFAETYKRILVEYGTILPLNKTITALLNERYICLCNDNFILDAISYKEDSKGKY